MPAGLPIPIRLAVEPGRLPCVCVRWGESEHTFLFDTGAGVTLVTPALAASKGAEPYGRLTGYRMRGERVDFAQVSDVALSIGGRALVPGPVGVFDVGALLPPDWPRVDGVLSLASFAGERLTIDAPQSTLVWESAESLAARAAGMLEVSARIARPVQGVALDVFLEGRVGGRRAWLELDTGNLGPVIAAAHIGLEPTERGGKDLEVRLAGESAPWRTRVVVTELILDGNLGSSFLAERVVSLDLDAARAWVAPAGR